MLLVSGFTGPVPVPGIEFSAASTCAAVVLAENVTVVVAACPLKLSVEAAGVLPGVSVIVCTSSKTFIGVPATPLYENTTVPVPELLNVTVCVSTTARPSPADGTAGCRGKV